MPAWALGVGLGGDTTPPESGDGRDMLRSHSGNEEGLAPGSAARSVGFPGLRDSQAVVAPQIWHPRLIFL